VGIGDFNADGKPDIIFQNKVSRDLAYWYMNGVTETSLGNLSPSNPGTIYWQVYGIGDFNADGKPDLLFQEQLGGDMLYWLMNGITETSYSYTSPANPN
jgi:hypothetical protein